MKQAKQSVLGFTLIELMIVVGIVAIIVAIALPAYTTHVTRTNRAEAQQMLSETAQALERCFTRFGSYTAAQCEVGFPIDGDNYVMAADEQDVDATEFVLTATPIGAQASRDAGKCDSLSLTHRGVRDRTGTSDRCWP